VDIGTAAAKGKIEENCREVIDKENKIVTSGERP
jgi:hypothetical protein